MLHPGVIAAKEKLLRGREKLRQQHDGGSPGIQVCTRLTELLDSVVLDLYRLALDEVGGGIENQFALVPNGGYGRRDVAPFSDVDLLLLHPPNADDLVTPFAKKLHQFVFDTGLDLGFSARSIDNACNMAEKDATVFTTLAEARFLCGDESLFERFVVRYRKMAQSKSKMFIKMIQEARREERKQYGETVFLLNPNVKRSRGGLRDLQLVRWIGFARFGEADPDNLVRLGVLSKADYNTLLKAREFLLRLRNELHFRAGKPQDVLGKDEQVRIAEKFGYHSDDAMLAVERFMRDYFEHTSEVRFAGAHFILVSRPQNAFWKAFEPLISHQVERDFRVGPTSISATRRGLAKVTSDLAQVLRLMDLAKLYSKRIDDATWRAIRDAMMNRPDMELTDEGRKRFLSLISQTSNFCDMLRRLHELRALERIIPPMAHARYLMQFNEYHKYTVDEHSIRAVEAAIGFKGDNGPLGEAYRTIKNKRILHLAILMHDLGKGFSEEHCIVGRRLAAETAEYLKLPEAESETLQFLVHKHLTMAHLSQYRDINDNRVVVQFAVEVGSPDWLQMLYVLTCADMAAVGPNTLTNWKLELLTRLYQRTRRQLMGESLTELSERELARMRDDLRKMCKTPEQATWWDHMLGCLSATYLLETPLERAFDELERLRSLPKNDATAWARYRAETKAMEYSVATYEQITPGIFHKLTGALTSKGLQILGADINTLTDDFVLDRFYVLDMDFADEPPPERQQEIIQTLIKALKEPGDKLPAFRKLWKPSEGKSNAPKLPNQVHVDGSSSDQFTIVDVFAHDEMGLLYTITRTIFELGLSVHGARIGTHLDQVVDVFYVTERDGTKVKGETRPQEIQDRLIKALESFSSS